MGTPKIQVILDCPAPEKVRMSNRSWVSQTFTDGFIASYSDITVLLTRLTRKEAPWVWSPQCEPFNSSKRPFFRHTLQDFDRSLPPVVETDASDYAIATIISVHTEDGQVHPLASFSRTLSGGELSYDTHDKELFATFEAFKTWRQYLECRHHRIDVIMDHKNLEYFSSTEMLTRRQARRSGFLSAFNMVICFRPGTLGEKRILILGERISTLQMEIGTIR